MTERGPGAFLQAALWLAGAAFYSAYGWAQPFVFGDEGYLYYLSRAVAEGQAPLRDFHLQSYMPGLFYAFAGPAGVAGRSVDLLRLFMVPWLALTPVLALRCAWRLTAGPFALAAALVILVVPGPWMKFYVAGLSLLVLEAALLAAERPDARHALGAGAAVGLSLGLRIDVAIVGAAVVAAALWLGPRAGRWRRAAWCAAGGALAWAPFAAMLAARGVLGIHLHQLAGFLPEMARRAGAGLQLPAPPAPLPLFRPLDPFGALFYASTAVLIAFALVTALTRDETERRRRVLVLAWAAGSAPPYLWERPDMPHFTQRAFCFLLPLTVLAHEAWRRRGGPSVPSRLFFLAAPAACAAFAIAYVAVTLRAGEGGSVSALWRPRREVRLSNGTAYTSASYGVPPALLERVLEQTRDGEPVGALPYQPGVNFLTGRPLPGRYVFLVPHTVTSPEVERRYADELARARYVVYVPGQNTTGTPRGLLPAYAPLVADLLAHRYRVEMEIGGYRLLRRRDERSDP